MGGAVAAGIAVGLLIREGMAIRKASSLLLLEKCLLARRCSEFSTPSAVHQPCRYDSCLSRRSRQAWNTPLPASLSKRAWLKARMSEEEQRAVESFVAHQMLDTYGQVMDGINNHPLSMTVDSFWDVLLTKPHRYDVPHPVQFTCFASAHLSWHAGCRFLRCW